MVLFHYSNSTLPTIRGNFLSEYLYFGQYGVQVFFVISGYVIPFSMYQNQYRFKNYGNFLWRRFLRIAPPSYASILLTVGLYFSAILLIGRPIEGMGWPGLNISSIFGNLTYTVDYLDTSWFNPVFWTLAIEFQFYVFIGLAFFLLHKNRKFGILLLYLLVLGLGFVKFEWFFRYGSYFLLGCILFLRKEQILSDPLLVLLSMLSIVCCFLQSGVAPFLFGLASFLLIFSSLQIGSKPLVFLGKVSYSLYLTHSVVGAVAEILLKDLISLHEYEWGKVLLMFVYTLIAIVFSSFFYKNANITVAPAL